MRTLLFVLLSCAPLAAALAHPAAAAMLRPLVTLGSAVVRLSDLFDDAGAHADLALGPAPAPGDSITVEAPQLAAIAREFGVAWRPASDSDRAILQRPGVPLGRDAVLAALRAALDGAGVPQGEIALPGFDAPLVAPDAHARATVEQLSFDPASGRFTAALAVAGGGMATLRLQVGGQVQATETVLVAAHRLAPDVLLRAGDVRPARVRSATLVGEVVRAAAQIEGLAPRRAVPEGEPLLLGDLVKPPVVLRGANVAISLDSFGLSLSSIGQALEPGAVGARISVLNPVSHAVLLAEVTGPGAVRLEPGAMPLRPGNDARHGFAGGLRP